MADTGTSTVVKITIDDSGVSSGINRVERSIANLGQTVSNSAAAAAGSVANIGNGANQSAAAIDKATNNMAKSIQHTTLLMEAGARGTAEYYTALANAKGLNMATLQPYIAQLEAVTARTKAAAEANRRLEESAQFLESLRSRSDAIGKTASQLAAMRAAELGVTSAAAPMIARLAEAERGMQGVGMSAAATAAAMRNVPAQFTDMVVGLQSGQAPLTVLLQQGGQLNDMFGGVGNAAKAMGTYVLGLITPMTLAATAVGALIFAFSAARSEAQELNKTLILSGNSVVANAGKMQDMAISIRNATEFTRGASVAALSEIATVGRVGAVNLEGFARVAQQMERTIGKSVNETASDLAELGKAPTAATAKLNEKYQYLTGTIYRQIKALEDQGRASAAATLAQETYMSSMDTKTKLLKENLGYIETGWHKVTSAAKNAWDAILDVGREDTLTEKLDKAKKKMGQTEEQLKARGQFGRGDFGVKLRPELSVESTYQAQKDDTIALSRRLLLQDNIVASENAATIARGAETKWIDQGNQYLTKRQQMAKELATVRNEGAAAGVSDAEIDTRLTQVKRKYADLNNVYIVSLENARNLEKESFTGQLSNLEAQHNQLLLSDEAYVTAKRNIQLKDLDSEAALIRQQAKIAGGKEDLSERDRYLGQLKVLEQRRKNIINDAQQSINQYAFVSNKAIEDQSVKWRDASKDEQEMLEDEIRLYGKSAEAKKIDAAQIKVEAEFRDFLTAAKKKNQALSPQEIEFLEREVASRKKNITAIEGERQAIAAAEQLRAENEQFAIDAIFGDAERSKAKLAREANIYRERLRLAGEGTEAQKRLQEEFDTWYLNQSVKPMLDAQRDMWASIESAAHDAFINIFDGGKSVFDRLRDTLKAGLLDLLYQMTIKKWIVNIGASVSSAVATNAAASIANGQDASAFGSASNLFTYGKLLWQGFSGGFATIMDKFGTTVQTGINMFKGMTYGEASMSAEVGASSNASGIGMAGGIAAAVVAAMMIDNNLYKNGWNIKNGISDNAASRLFNLGAPMGGLASMLGPLGLVKMSDNIGQKLGLSSQLASILSGSSVISAIFGRKDPQVTRQGIAGTVGANGFTGNTETDWFSKGGWFSSDLSGRLKGEVPAQIASMLGDTYKAIKDASADFAKTLGLDADYLQQRTQALSFDIGKDDAETQANISKIFSNLANDIGGELLNLGETVAPGFRALAKSGEDASTTLARLAGDVKAADKLFALLGQVIPTVSTASVAAKANLVEMGGGLEKFTDNATYFAQNFLTQAEQMAPTIKSVSEQMKALGLADISTIEQFSNVVKGLDLKTDAGAKLYTALVELAPSFKLVTDYATQLANDTTTANNQIKSALKAINDPIQKEIDNLFASTQTLDQRRAAEKVGQDPSTILLLNKRNQLQDEIQAGQDAETAKQSLLALSKTRVDLEIGLMRALGNEEGALARERQRTLDTTTDAISKELLIKTFAAQDKKKAEDEAKQKADAETAARAAAAQAAAQALQTAQQEAERQAQAAKQAYDQHISDLRSKLQTAYNKESSALTEIINKTQSFADAARQAADALTLGALSPLSDKQKYDMLKTSLPEIIGKANAFDPEALGQLQQFTELSKLTSSTFDEYTSDINLVYSTLVGSAASAQTQVSIAKASLDVMKTQVDALLNVDQGIGSVADQIAALNAAMAVGLSGVASAVYGQYQANNPASASPVVTTTTGPTPDQIYGGLAGEGAMQQSRMAALKSEADKQAKVQAYMDKMLQQDLLAAQSGGVTNQYYMDLNDKYYTQAGFEKFARELGLFADPLLPTASRLPRFANGGFHAGGLRLVGEVGAELEVTGPARYYNAAQTASLLRSGGADNTEVVAELRAMGARLEAIESNTQATAGHTNRAANTLDDASDGDALLMRAGT